MTVPPNWSETGPEKVGSGIHRIPLPLPHDSLKAVNVYAIEAGGDLVLIDAGWILDESRQALEAGLAAIGYDLGQVARFLVTHSHRDHYTLGVALRREFGMRLAIGLGERPTLERLYRPEHDVRGLQSARLRTNGAQPLIDELNALDVPPHEWRNWEPPDEWLTDRQIVTVGDRHLEVIATPGHTRGHVVYVDRAEQLMFSGDHILPHITPSIGLEPGDGLLPLAAYLDSLTLMEELPELRMLPAHGEVRDRIHPRVAELKTHHATRLAQTLLTVRDGARTPYDSACVLTWTRRERPFDTLDLFNRILATNETQAHLEVLVLQGLLTSATADGVTTYEPAD